MFKYRIIDDFLSKNDLDIVSNLKLGKIENKGKRVFHNRIYKNGVIESSCLSKEIIKSMHNRYFPKAINLLKEFSEKKIELYEYSDFHIVITGKDYNYPIHVDAHNKLLSGVVYLKPNNNLGTRLYEENKKDFVDLEWKSNRSLFFSRSNKTFHSYKSNGISERVTLIYNLMTTNVKDVCKIDGDSYKILKLKEYFKSLLN